MEAARGEPAPLTRPGDMPAIFRQETSDVCRVTVSDLMNSVNAS
jgi:hypothetical protein